MQQPLLMPVAIVLRVVGNVPPIYIVIDHIITMFTETRNKNSVEPKRLISQTFIMIFLSFFFVPIP